MDRPGHVAVQTKLWSTDPEWKPGLDEEPLELFEPSNEGMQIFPTGVLELVKPHFNLRHNFEDIARNIAILKHFPPHEQTKWWRQLLEDQQSLVLPAEEWYLAVLRPLEPDVQVQKTTKSTESPMQLAMERDRNAVPVYTGKRKKPQKTNRITPTQNKKHVRHELGYTMVTERDDEVFVGKVSQIRNTTTDIVLFTGTQNGSWAPITVQVEKPTQRLSRRTWWKMTWFSTSQLVTNCLQAWNIHWASSSHEHTSAPKKL